MIKSVCVNTELRKKMTREEALLKGIKIWEWLAENPSEGKTAAYTTLHLDFDVNFCPMCEYATQEMPHPDCYMCDYCPVWSYEFRCDHSTQPYYRYMDANNQYLNAQEFVAKRQLEARAVADQIREKLNES